jgi:hypothetical protein
MKLQFQADNDLDHRIVVATRRLEPAIDFQTAPALGLHGRVPDDRVLGLAAEQGRILVSHDRKTMPEHFARFIVLYTSPGLIIVSRKLSIGKAAEWLHLLWAASEAEEYVNSIYSLP